MFVRDIVRDILADIVRGIFVDAALMMSLRTDRQLRQSIFQWPVRPLPA